MLFRFSCTMQIMLVKHSNFELQAISLANKWKHFFLSMWQLYILYEVCYCSKG